MKLIVESFVISFLILYIKFHMPPLMEDTCIKKMDTLKKLSIKLPDNQSFMERG